MFMNNVVVALRNLRKHKLFATMNVLGLAIGLVVFVFGFLLVQYEANHDRMFDKVDRIYTIGSTIAEGVDVGVAQVSTTYSAFAPLLQTELPDIEHVVRSISSEYLVSRDENGFYESIRFVDDGFLEVFNLDYLYGDAAALAEPNSMLMTESAAVRFFGSTDIVGNTLTLDNQHEVRVSAVVRDLPRNTHFNSSVIMDADFEIAMSLSSLSGISGYPMEGNWNNLSLSNSVYVLLPENLDRAWLQSQVDAVYERSFPDGAKEVVGALTVTPLVLANLAVWDTIGLPAVTIAQFLSLLVLLVACVNYTNLATAQSLGRSREVGMRKTMGASRRQLLLQFLTESLVIAAIAMLVALAALEVLIPVFNNLTDKVMTLNYLSTLPMLATIVLLVGFGAGAYPAVLITRASPIEALGDSARKGKKGSRMRSFMIAGQFAISAFMLALVAVVYMQNKKVESASLEFPRSEVYILSRLGIDDIQPRLDTLERELEALPNIDEVTFSSQVPFEQNNSSTDFATTPGDEAGATTLQILRMRPDFLEAYSIPLLAGRNLDKDSASDHREEGRETINVIVNELTVTQMGFASPQDAINQRIYDLNEVDYARELIIVGVVPTQNITGFFNSRKPWIYWYQEESMRVGSIRITGGNMLDNVDAIESAWKRVIPDYPPQGRFLDDVFNDVFSILRLMNYSLAGFAFVAMSLALFGLFGLAAFMATQRTKEIGVRKVLGASNLQIAKLLVWQFSRPVIWALLIALPLAYLATSAYLNFFPDRITAEIVILGVAGFVSVVLAWLTVAGHAIRIARANPIHALRYE
ncbi:MAG: FtsX-like permease family protein [Pseudomonadota bacterium]